MTVKSKGITKFVVAPKEDALLPSIDPPTEKLVKKSLSNEDPLKSCVRERLSEGGRSEEEATAWCRDYLSMKADYGSEAAADSANIKEAERIFIQTREDIMKPRELEQCIENRQNLFGEGPYTAGKNCRRDWELSERLHPSQPQDLQHGPIATDDIESRLSILDPPESFQQLERLRIQLDSRTTALMEESHVVHGSRIYHYTSDEAERKARKELGLPQVYHPKQPDVATVPDVTGKSRAQRIQESQAVTADKRLGERMISPGSGVPDLYLKPRKQVLKEVFEQDAEDKNR